MSYEGSGIPDTCDLHISSQTAAHHFQPQPRIQTTPSCSGSLFPRWELLLGKVPLKPGTHNPSSHPGQAPQRACSLSGACFPGLKITSLGETFLHTRKAEL